MACTPRKGKASCKTVKGKKVSYGQAGVKPGKKGSARQKAFCARHSPSAYAKQGKKMGAAAKAARKRWGC